MSPVYDEHSISTMRGFRDILQNAEDESVR